MERCDNYNMTLLREEQRRVMASAGRTSRPCGQWGAERVASGDPVWPAGAERAASGRRRRAGGHTAPATDQGPGVFGGTRQRLSRATDQGPGVPGWHTTLAIESHRPRDEGAGGGQGCKG